MTKNEREWRNRNIKRTKVGVSTTVITYYYKADNVFMSILEKYHLKFPTFLVHIFTQGTPTQTGSWRLIMERYNVNRIIKKNMI